MWLIGKRELESKRISRSRKVRLIKRCRELKTNIVFRSARCKMSSAGCKWWLGRETLFCSSSKARATTRMRLKSNHSGRKSSRTNWGSLNTLRKNRNGYSKSKSIFNRLNCWKHRSRLLSSRRTWSVRRRLKFKTWGSSWSSRSRWSGTLTRRQSRWQLEWNSYSQRCTNCRGRLAGCGKESKSWNRRWLTVRIDWSSRVIGMKSWETGWWSGSLLTVPIPCSKDWPTNSMQDWSRPLAAKRW